MATHNFYYIILKYNIYLIAKNHKILKNYELKKAFHPIYIGRKTILPRYHLI